GGEEQGVEEQAVEKKTMAGGASHDRVGCGGCGRVRRSTTDGWRRQAPPDRDRAQCSARGWEEARLYRVPRGGGGLGEGRRSAGGRGRERPRSGQEQAPVAQLLRQILVDHEVQPPLGQGLLLGADAHRQELLDRLL